MTLKLIWAPAPERARSTRNAGQYVPRHAYERRPGSPQFPAGVTCLPLALVPYVVLLHGERNQFWSGFGETMIRLSPAAVRRLD